MNFNTANGPPVLKVPDEKRRPLLKAISFQYRERPTGSQRVIYNKHDIELVIFQYRERPTGSQSPR